MKKIILFLTILLLTSITFAQDAKKNGWIRVQSDDGEFSIEIPKKYGYFYDKEGFSLRSWGGISQLSEMSVLNAYSRDTLLSFERYKVDEIKPNKAPKTNYQPPFIDYQKSFIERVLALFSTEDPRYLSVLNIDKRWDEIKKNNYNIGQLTRDSKDEFTIKQYFFSQQFIYILTASSRKGLTSETKQFLDSVIFSADEKGIKSVKTKLFSDLKKTSIKYSENLETENTPAKSKVSNAPTKLAKLTNPLLFISNPSVPYTADAIKNRERGIIRLETTFSKTGQITDIILRKSLKYNLDHNAFLTILRMKFLPAEKNGKPISIVKTIDYEFEGY